MSATWRDRAAVLVSAVLAVLLLGPALRPGYVLQADLVFVPRQALLPWMLGLGGGLPRAVPQDLVVSGLTALLPGWVWQDLALVAALVLLGSGTGRLARPAGRRAALAASVVAVWSPYVGERLLLGHWSLLLAVALVPWALVHARAARDGAPGAGARWLLVVALASLTVTGGLLVLSVTAPVLLWRGGSGGRGGRLAVAACGALLQLPWLVPAVLHPSSASAVGAEVFALRAEGPWGLIVTALGTGGAWNASAAPGSRGTWLAPLLTVALLLLSWHGRRALADALGRPVLVTLLAASVVGLVVAVGGAAWPEGAAWAVERLPGGGVLRDGQKLLAPWLLLLAVAAGCGAARLSWQVGRRSRDGVAGAAALVAVLVLPLACAPDLVWGSLGRLAAVAYPDDWEQVRATLEADPGPGDVVALPWSTFRAFPWNAGRTVLDPAPRYFPRTVVTDHDLVVSHGGELVVVPGDDPRSTRVAAALGSPDPAAGLRAEGIGWVLVEQVDPEEAPLVPSGAVLVVRGPTLALYRLPAPADPPALSAVGPVVLGNAVAGAIVLVAGLALLRRRFAHGEPRKVPAQATEW